MRAKLEVLNGGAGRGAEQNLQYFKAFNQLSTRFEIAPLYADPVPGRASERARQAREIGVKANWAEATITEKIRVRSERVMLNLDNPGAIREALLIKHEVSFNFQMLARTPDDNLFGLAGTLPAEEDREPLADLFLSFHRITARSGSEHIIGDRGLAQHRIAEPMYRQWLGNHTKTNLLKIASGLPPNAQPLELTMNGRDTLPVVINQNKGGWLNPGQLAEKMIAKPPIPLLRGEDFMIADTRSEQVRFLPIHLRKRDGRPAWRRGTGLFDPTLADRAIRGADRITANMTMPLLTTD